MYKTNTDFRRLFRLFGRKDGSEEVELPFEVLDRIQPVVEMADWSAYRNIQAESIALVNVGSTNGSTVPQNIMRMFIHGGAFDVRSAVESRTLWLNRVTVAGIEINYVPAVQFSVSTVGVVGFNKPLLLLPGENLRARTDPVGAGGDQLGLTTLWIDFPLFEANALRPT